MRYSAKMFLKVPVVGSRAGISPQSLRGRRTDRDVQVSAIWPWPARRPSARRRGRGVLPSSPEGERQLLRRLFLRACSSTRQDGFLGCSPSPQTEQTRGRKRESAQLRRRTRFLSLDADTRSVPFGGNGRDPVKEAPLQRSPRRSSAAPVLLRRRRTSR